MLSWALDRIDLSTTTREQYIADLEAPLEGSYERVDDRKLAESEMEIFRSGRRAMGI